MNLVFICRTHPCCCGHYQVPSIGHLSGCPMPRQYRDNQRYIYEEDLPSPELLEQEFFRWRRHWMERWDVLSDVENPKHVPLRSRVAAAHSGQTYLLFCKYCAQSQPLLASVSDQRVLCGGYIHTTGPAWVNSV